MQDTRRSEWLPDVTSKGKIGTDPERRATQQALNISTRNVPRVRYERIDLNTRPDTADGRLDEPGVSQGKPIASCPGDRYSLCIIKRTKSVISLAGRGALIEIESKLCVGEEIALRVDRVQTDEWHLEVCGQVSGSIGVRTSHRAGSSFACCVDQ
jgi:hypothetical protein